MAHGVTVNSSRGNSFNRRLRTRDAACITFDTITNSTTRELLRHVDSKTCGRTPVGGSQPSRAHPRCPHQHHTRTNDALYALHTPRRRKGLAKTQARAEHRGTPTPLYHSCDETQIYAQLLRVASNFNDHERQSTLQALRTQCPISSSTLPCSPNNCTKPTFKGGGKNMARTTAATLEQKLYRLICLFRHKSWKRGRAWWPARTRKAKGQVPNLSLKPVSCVEEDFQAKAICNCELQCVQADKVDNCMPTAL